MSKVLERIKSEGNIDVNVVIRGEKDGVFMVEATLTRFSPRSSEKGGADVVKKANYIYRNADLNLAQFTAIEKAGELLGLGLEG
jgi:hypothetical protein